MNEAEGDGRARAPGRILERPKPRQPEPAAWKRTTPSDTLGAGGPDPVDELRPPAALVSFHYLRSALRRRWFLCGLLAGIGALFGIGYLFAKPTLPTATATLLLAHAPQADPNEAISTDVSLMTTREVAERTISELGLSMRPVELMNSVHALPSGSAEILQLTMTAPSESEAVRRLDRFTKEYLDFRSKQLSAQSDILIKGYNDQIAAVNLRVRDVNARISNLAAHGDTATDRLSDAVTERSQLTDKISGLEDQVQNETLRQNSIVLGSRVIDAPAPLPPGGLRRTALVLMSGLIVGLAIGVGLVVAQALVSDRLWLRVEAASALHASVLVSVRRIAPLPRYLKRAKFLPWLRTLDGRRAADRQRLGRAIERAVPEPGTGHRHERPPAGTPGRQSLAVICVGNSQEMRFGVVAAAEALQHHGRTAALVDLTEAGGVASAVSVLANAAAEQMPEALRPSVIPSAREVPSHVEWSDWEAVARAEGRNGVTLILADLDVAVGVDHLTAWADRVVVAVTAGKSSVELILTAGDLIRSAGLHLHGVVLLKAERDDTTSGLVVSAESDADAGKPAPTGIHNGSEAG
jgi:capsular polysaccharide biosynthesis protein